MTNKSAQQNLLNEHELSSVNALLSYIAHNQKTNEAIVREILTTRFGIGDIEELQKKDYEDAIKFLIDVQIATILN